MYLHHLLVLKDENVLLEFDKDITDIFEPVSSVFMKMPSFANIIRTDLIETTCPHPLNYVFLHTRAQSDITTRRILSGDKTGVIVSDTELGAPGNTTQSDVLKGNSPNPIPPSLVNNWYDALTKPVYLRSIQKSINIRSKLAAESGALLHNNTPTISVNTSTRSAYKNDDTEEKSEKAVSTKNAVYSNDKEDKAEERSVIKEEDAIDKKKKKDDDVIEEV